MKNATQKEGNVTRETTTRQAKGTTIEEERFFLGPVMIGKITRVPKIVEHLFAAERFVGGTQVGLAGFKTRETAAAWISER